MKLENKAFALSGQVIPMPYASDAERSLNWMKYDIFERRWNTERAWKTTYMP